MTIFLLMTIIFLGFANNSFTRSYIERINSSTNKVLNFTQKAKTLIDSLRETQKQIEELEQQETVKIKFLTFITREKEKIEGLQGNLTEAKSMSTNLQTQIEETNQLITQTQEEIETLATTKTELERDIELYRESIETLNQRIKQSKKLSENIETLKVSIQQKELEITTQNSATEDLRNQTEPLMEEIESLEQSLKAEQAKNKSLVQNKKRLESQLKDMNDLHARTTKVKEGQIADLKSQIAEEIKKNPQGQAESVEEPSLDDDIERTSNLSRNSSMNSSTKLFKEELQSDEE